MRDRNKDTGERTEPTIEEWEEIDHEMIRTGAYTVYDEQDEIEALENEEDRRMFLFYIVRESGKSHWIVDQAKETVRQSRTHYGDPVPEDEFFGF